MLFLLVARTGRLSAAAAAAGLSQPRVSQRMRALEESLGRSLLTRGRRGVALTPEGLALEAALGAPLDEASQAFARIRGRTARAEVVILTDIAFASHLLLPEVPQLSAAFPGLGISVLSRQRPHPQDAPGAHLMIRMERPEARDGPAALLFDERVGAVCSPGYRAANPDLRRAADLAGHTLIELTSGADAPWFGWDEWLGTLGCRRDGAGGLLAFDSFDHVVRSARSGLGVALCWEVLLDVDAPGSGLVRAVPDVLRSDRGYVLRRLSEGKDGMAAPVFDWLRDRFSAPAPRSV